MTWHPDIPEEYRNQIVTGDARELTRRIPDESIDLIFTDPVYDRIEDYEWLGDMARRVLKSTGALLCWSNGKWHRRNTDWLTAIGLIYRWTFACIMHGGPQPMNGRIIAKTNRVLWLDKGESTLLDYWPDGYISTTKSNLSGFKWTKSPSYTSHGVKNLCPIEGVVFDPFTGGGTVPAVCKMLGRNYIAFEIDPETAELARERIRNTQPPLFVLEPEQQELGI